MLQLGLPRVSFDDVRACWFSILTLRPFQILTIGFTGLALRALQFGLMLGCQGLEFTHGHCKARDLNIPRRLQRQREHEVVCPCVLQGFSCSGHWVPLTWGSRAQC